MAWARKIYFCEFFRGKASRKNSNAVIPAAEQRPGGGSLPAWLYYLAARDAGVGWGNGLARARRIYFCEFFRGKASRKNSLAVTPAAEQRLGGRNLPAWSYYLVARDAGF